MTAMHAAHAARPVVGRAGEEEVVVDAAVAAVLHQVVIDDVGDDVVTELPLDEAHDPLAVADDVVLAESPFGPVVKTETWLQ